MILFSLLINVCNLYARTTSKSNTSGSILPWTFLNWICLISLGLASKFLSQGKKKYIFNHFLKILYFFIMFSVTNTKNMSAPYSSFNFWTSNIYITRLLGSFPFKQFIFELLKSPFWIVLKFWRIFLINFDIYSGQNLSTLTTHKPFLGNKQTPTQTDRKVNYI